MVTISSHVYAVHAVLDYVCKTGEWVVIVAPPNGSCQALQQTLAAIRPPQGVIGGRTLLMPSGGRLTVVNGTHGIKDGKYLVMFLGYDSQLSTKEEIALHTWRQTSKGSITLGDRVGELRINRKAMSTTSG